MTYILENTITGFMTKTEAVEQLLKRVNKNDTLDDGQMLWYPESYLNAVRALDVGLLYNYSVSPRGIIRVIGPGETGFEVVIVIPER